MRKNFVASDHSFPPPASRTFPLRSAAVAASLHPKHSLPSARPLTRHHVEVRPQEAQPRAPSPERAHGPQRGRLRAGTQGKIGGVS